MIKLEDIQASDSGKYKCIASTQNNTTSYNRVLRTVPRPLIMQTQPVSILEVPHNFAPMRRYRCLSESARISRINMAKVAACPEGTNAAYKAPAVRHAALIFYQPKFRGSVMRCKLKINVQSAHCIKGFGKLLKHSTASGYILESEEVYKITPEQCRNAHNLNQISLTLGTSVLTLRTLKLWRQASVSFLTRASEPRQGKSST